MIPSEFFASAEYGRIVAMGEQLDGLLGADAYIQRGEKQQPVDSFKQVMDWLLDEAKRGSAHSAIQGTW